MKKSLLRIVFAIAFLFTSIVPSRAQTFLWAKSSVGTGTSVTGDVTNSINTDASGNVFITGFFSNSTIAFGTTTLTNISNRNIFLTKYDSNGNVLWSKSAGGPNSDEANSVSTDASGNAYITGDFQSPNIAFGTTTLTNTGGGTITNVFITKYDLNGNVLWAKSAGGTSDAGGTSVCTDNSGNIFITGYFTSPTITFGTTTLTKTGVNDGIFVVKYDVNGNVIWAKGTGGTNNDDAFSISTDATGNVFITGTFYSPSVIFGSYTLYNTASSSVFLVKYDPNGNVIWAKSSISISANYDYGYSVNTDASGNSFITGSFESPNIAFGTYTLTNAGFSDIFLAKYDVNGNVIWAKSYGGSSWDGAYSVSTYSNGVYLAGSFYSPTITFDTYTLTPPTGWLDPMFITLCDLNGNAICVKALTSGGDDNSIVSADKFGNAYLAGDFQANPFIVGSNTLTLTSSEDVFVAKFNCSLATEIKNYSENLTEKIYPNPNNGSFSLQIENEIANGELILFNSLGQQVHSQKITQGENKIITNGLARGLYHYTILQNRQQISDGKMVAE
jgi:hypothetical protein